MAYNQELFEKFTKYIKHCDFLETHINSFNFIFETLSGERIFLFDPHDDVHVTNFNLYDELMLSVDDNEELFDFYMELCDAIEDERYEEAIVIKEAIANFI